MAETQTLTSISIFQREDVIEKFRKLLWERTGSFLTSVMNIVSSNTQLKEADSTSIYLAALTSATLNLPINQNLWFAYIVPYKNKDWKKEWQFQMWYKGFIQLAQRSGQFKTISATPVYEWQLVEENPLTWFVFDRKAKTSDVIVWYASYFQLLNWFEKTLYMTKKDLEKHANSYSANFKKYQTWLRKDKFDEMAIKTVLKLLLSKFAPLSVEMQKAVISDQAVIKDENLDNMDYIDNDQEIIDWVDLDEKLKEVKLLEDKKSDQWTT